MSYNTMLQLPIVKEEIAYCKHIAYINGLNKFEEKGKQAAIAEIEQLHNREVFDPIFPQEIIGIEKTKAMKSLIFLQ